MDLGLQIWYTGYVGVQMGTAFGGSLFLCTPFFIACVPDRTFSGLSSLRPKARTFSHPESRPPMPAGDGCRRTGRSPEFSAMRLWHRLAAKPPGFRFPPESAALPQPCRCSAALIILPYEYLPFVPPGFRAVLFSTLRRCAFSTRIPQPMRTKCVRPVPSRRRRLPPGKAAPAQNRLEHPPDAGNAPPGAAGTGTPAHLAEDGSAIALEPL